MSHVLKTEDAPMSDTMSQHVVRLDLKDGPITIQDSPFTGIASSHKLWNGITASEYFPPKRDSAFFVISLEKAVTNACDVRAIERELGDAFLMIAASWSFSGGSHLALEIHQFINAPRFETNADKIEQQLLTQIDRKKASASSSMPVETGATYVRAPLACAVEIAKHMRKDFITHQLLISYNHAWRDFYQLPGATTASWYVNLYKAREILQLPFGKSDDATRAALRISRAEWRRFGDISLTIVICALPS
jgi:hypothetical protein